jgi:hypothetical protein
MYSRKVYKEQRHMTYLVYVTYDFQSNNLYGALCLSAIFAVIPLAVRD